MFVMKVPILFLALTRLAFAVNDTTQTPAGCKKLSTDAGWPTPAEWTAAMPEVEPHKQTNGSRYPDYVLRAESYKDVQSAVQFCAKNDIRVSIITSGHVSSQNLLILDQSFRIGWIIVVPRSINLLMFVVVRRI
jgi:FAD/FMN-containing dehydrogenase